MEFERRRVLTRIKKLRPRLVLLVAPAGYGKTTLARQFAAEFASWSACDCAGATSERDFARRLIAARSSSAASDPNVAPLQVSLAESGGSLDDVESALRAWSSDVASTAVIFENVEAIVDDAALRKLFERALVMTPESCTLVVCSRRVPRLQASRIAPPHRVVTLRADDLAFDRAEIAAAFARTKVAKAMLDDVAAATRGWPIGVLMLRRLADEGRLAASLAHLDDVALDDMHGYLVDEVFAALAPDERDGVIACAAFSAARPADVAAAIGLASDDEAVDLVRRLAPLALLGNDGTIDVHPLLDAALETRYRTERAAFARTAARAFEARGAFFEAAKVVHRFGHRDDAARLLCAEASAGTRRPPPGFGALLATLDAETLARYPVLRGLTTYARRFRVDPHLLREETRAVWSTMRDAPFELRCNVGNPLARIMYETGRFDEAETLLRELEREAGGVADVPRSAGEAYVARTLACVLARSGRLREASSYFQKGYYAIPGAEFVLSRASIETAIVERLHGRLDEERRLFERAIAQARDVNANVHLACALAEAAFGAWLAGDGAAHLDYVRRLDEMIRRDAMPGFAHFCAVAYGDADAATNGTEQPNWLACAHLIASAASSGAARVRHAEAAKRAADESSDRYLRLLAAVALGLASPAERGERFAEALLHAAAIEATAPRDAVAALIADAADAGILTGFVAAFRAGEADDAAPPVRVDVLALAVYVGGERVALPQRELAIVLALARRRKAFARAEIAPLVWPDLDEDAAREAFNSTLYRLRRRLPDVVTYGRDGYRLDDRVRVDLRELEHWVASLSSRRALREQERIVFRALHERLRGAVAPSDDETWAWLDPIFLRADDMRRTIAVRLAQDALERGEFDDALGFARRLIADDACDESARELAVRAYLAAGKRGDAIREFRQYRDALRRELDAEPSAAFARLLHESEAPSRATPARAS